jgi:hypothetical protein
MSLCRKILTARWAALTAATTLLAVPAHAAATQPLNVVAIGDSYASGEVACVTLRNVRHLGIELVIRFVRWVGPRFQRQLPCSDEHKRQPRWPARASLHAQTRPNGHVAAVRDAELAEQSRGRM